ncbi:MAG: glycine cleavage system protein H [Thermodesulfobacteriota bacterium]|nr:glycine cleavage system protein H [Thermodesulfobacteriota bacterium]
METNKTKSKKKKVIGFQVVEEECIWMKAGIVNFRMCDNAYDCYNCPFDKGMRKAMNLEDPLETGEEQPAWVAYLKKNFHGSSRPCRHSLTGRVEAPKICTMNYECYHCPYDQMLDEADFTQLAHTLSYHVASGYRMANGYYYHMGHSWARFEHGGRVRVGFDDFMVKLFGAIQQLTLPPLGAALKQDQVGWTFGKNDHKAAVLSPVTGTVLALNNKANEYPEIVNYDPYQEGWLFILEPDLPKRNLKRLYFEDESFQWMEQESKKLLGLLGPEYERLAATGGEPINDFFGQFPEIGWDTLTTTFLRTKKQ